MWAQFFTNRAVRELLHRNHPLARPTCLSCLTTGGPDKEYGAASENSLGEFTKGLKEGGDGQLSRVLLTVIHLGWEIHTSPGRTLIQTMGQSRWLARDNPETNPITINGVSHMAEQLSRAPLPCCFLRWCPFPIKPFAFGTCVSSDNSFPSAKQEPTFGPWKRSLFLHNARRQIISLFTVNIPNLQNGDNRI